jgi:site-specific DNA-methyltransferase (adenine-specific)
MNAPYYENEAVTLWHGDALAVLPELDPSSARAVLLDPPYAMAPVSVRGIDDGAAGASGAPVRLLSESLREAQRILTPGGVAAILCDWRRVPDVSYLVTLAGLRLTSCVAWTRTTVGTGGMFRSAWDPILIASKGAPEVIDKAGIPNVVQANPPRVRTHPYEKPPVIWQHILRRLPPGVVIDPFAGSAASAEAAAATGFRWVGIESDAAFCAAAVRRLTAQPGLDFDEVPA